MGYQASFDPITSGITLVLGLIVLVYWVIKRDRERYEDQYLFEIPGWSHLKEDQALWETELVFTQGPINRLMDRVGFTLGNFHSHFVSADGSKTTGFVSLTRTLVGSALTTGSDGFDTGLTATTISGGSYRYFRARLPTTLAGAVDVGSADLTKVLPTVLEPASEYLKELEQRFGTGTWRALGAGNDFVVLVPETLDAGTTAKFLEICDRIVAAMKT